ncbi:uncharacterized protein VTP21DRAFT_10003 [Calcarisporiella thermophila]|uniref:uncharacterized protein n=1 Tax=Calcarisporiella thermophila TaxID=911321 RepID=UPI0037441A6A
MDTEWCLNCEKHIPVSLTSNNTIYCSPECCRVDKINAQNSHSAQVASDVILRRRRAYVSNLAFRRPAPVKRRATKLRGISKGI